MNAKGHKRTTNRKTIQSSLNAGTDKALITPFHLNELTCIIMELPLCVVLIYTYKYNGENPRLFSTPGYGFAFLSVQFHLPE